MLENVLLITNYSLKQLNEYKILLARTMRLNKTDGISMYVHTEKKNGTPIHVMEIVNGKRRGKINLLAIGLMYFPDVEAYVELNEQAEKMLFKEEWFYGLKDQPGLEQVMGAMNQAFFGIEPHPTVLDKAAYLWYTIATKQLFHNGNKRTALLAAYTLLNLNFFDLPNINPNELYDISLKLANKRMSQKQLKEYLMKHVVVSIDLMNLYLDKVRETMKDNSVDKIQSKM